MLNVSVKQPGSSFHSHKIYLTPNSPLYCIIQLKTDSNKIQLKFGYCVFVLSKMINAMC